MKEIEKDILLQKQFEDADENAFSRKKDHIELAFKSQIHEIDGRFSYEPLLSGHPKEGSIPQTTMFGKTLRAPIWVSSMTGGTEWAQTINYNLAKACAEFGMGMGLGSCRTLLYTNETLEDFNVRHLIGDDLPLFANLGIAQVEQLVESNKLYLITELLDKLHADGLIIHVNPMQEWLQPEGDRYFTPPLQTISAVIEQLDIKIVVKEVGQGMGYESIKSLLRLPIEAIDFAANGGTNFAKVELLRSTPQKQEIYRQLANIGHSAEEMTELTAKAYKELGDKAHCRQVIVSGGIKNFLDGYYLINKLPVTAIYGQASGFLKHARADYDTLRQHVDAQVKGLELAYALLKVKNNE
ncbi:MAG: isopentenyl-diphosphate delta-isomerase [Bacteroidota bacterium]